MSAIAVVFRPYAAIMRMRFLAMMQYRAAAVAGFATQCWWGAIKIMIFTAFYSGARGHQPITLANAITYTWLAQGFLVLMPWYADPDISLMARTGNVSFDRVRPIDTYAAWYAHSVGRIAARALPRAVLMFVLAAIVIPAVGLGSYRLRMPANVSAVISFAISMILVVILSGAIQMILNTVVVITLTDRGVNSIVAPIVNVLAGNVIPLLYFPSWMKTAMLLQPCASLLDIPNRIYFGNLVGGAAVAALAIQATWIAVVVVAGRAMLARAMDNLQVQGG
jgi:ABC-2 type transport system permease protein